MAASPRGSVLVLDLDTRAGLCCARSLGRAGTTVFVAARDGRATGLRTRYAARRVVLPDPEEDFDAYVAAILGELRSNPVDAVLSSIDSSVEALHRHRDEIGRFASPGARQPRGGRGRTEQGADARGRRPARHPGATVAPRHHPERARERARRRGVSVRVQARDLMAAHRGWRRASRTGSRRRRRRGAAGRSRDDQARRAGARAAARSRRPRDGQAVPHRREDDRPRRDDDRPDVAAARRLLGDAPDDRPARRRPLTRRPARRRDRPRGLLRGRVPHATTTAGRS